MASSFLALLLAGSALNQEKQSCPVTLEAERVFAEPSPSTAERFWYGSEDLAVSLVAGGTWLGLPERRYLNKIFWSRTGFDGMTEPRPALVVTGRRIDGAVPPVTATEATTTHRSELGGWVMLDVVEFSSDGCWELTGEYRGKRLRFVVRVGA